MKENLKFENLKEKISEFNDSRYSKEPLKPQPSLWPARVQPRATALPGWIGEFRVEIRVKFFKLLTMCFCAEGSELGSKACGDRGRDGESHGGRRWR